MRRRWARGIVLAALVLAGCGTGAGPEAVDPVEREVDAWVQVVRAVALADVPPPADDESLPVVFTVERDGNSVPAEVQVEVVKALLDEADIRFLDNRDEAIHVDEPGEPVKDDGLLLAMSPVPEDGRRVELDVALYRSATDVAEYVVVLRGGDPSWTVVSVAPPA